MKILVVDDDQSLFKSLKRALNGFGYQEINWAEDGKQGLEILLAEDDIGLLITDMDMPVMNGLALISTIKSSRTQLPIILSSGSLDIKAIPPGVIFLAKPYNVAALQAAIKAALK